MEKNQFISDADDNGGRMGAAGTFTNAIYPGPEAGVFLGNSEKLQAHRYHNALSYLEIQSSDKKWRCCLIPLIITVNVLIFAITMGVNNCGKNSGHCTLGFLGRFSFQPLKENPLFGPSTLTLLKMGGLQWRKVVHQGQKWRLLTCIWLHAGVVHLLANMLSLVAIGIRIEQEFGFLKIGLLYLLSGLGGSIMSALFVRHNISVGASGALFGLLGALLSELLTNWTIYENKVAGLLMLIFFIVLNLAVGILPHVDNFAHIGGFISGFLLGFVLLIRPQFGWINRKKIPLEPQINVSVKSKHTHYQYVLWFASLILLILGFVTGLVLLFRGVDLNKHCRWCHYMSCVPTKAWSCKDTEVYCMSSQNENRLTLTCQDGGRSKTYPYGNLSESRITSLCAQLCAQINMSDKFMESV